jgi:DNA-binding IclR family transcriptional regulator
MSKSSEVQSLSRAIAILRVFSIEEPELGVTEISRRVGLHKSTTFRLLSTLIAEGLVAQNPETERYRLGIGLLELAGYVQIFTEIRQAAGPYIQALAQESGGTVNVSVLEAGMSFNLEQAVPRGFLVNNYGWVGRRTPLHATSTGKVLLTWLSPAQFGATVDEPLEAFTRHTITDIEVLQDELLSVKMAGYAIGHEEYEIGLNAVAAPIYNRKGDVVAALSVSGPAYRLSPNNFETVAGAVIRTANRISLELGYVAEDSVQIGSNPP